MKRLLSLTLATCMLAQTTTVAYARTTEAAVATTPIQRVQSLQSLVSTFKHQVYAEGKNPEASIKKLASDILSQKYSIADLQLFVQMNAEPQEVEKFNRAITIALSDVKDIKSLSPEELTFVLKNAMESTTQTGANFMSCSVGMGIGVPLIAVGVIIGIIALVNASASKELVTEKYIQKRTEITTSYLNTKADLELEIATYKSDIIFYQDEIAELERQISAGGYTAVEIENMKKTIREYEFLISDANALMAEVQVDVDYYNSKYETDIAAMNSEEQSGIARVDERKAAAGKQAIAAGISAALGSVFVFAGVGDCN